jgi:hypothetical protein
MSTNARPIGASYLLSLIVGPGKDWPGYVLLFIRCVEPGIFVTEEDVQRRQVCSRILQQPLPDLNRAAESHGIKPRGIS